MRKLTIGLFSLMLIAVAPACNKNIEGCTDSNADNFNSLANKNKDCRYRYASNIDISDLPLYKPDGTAWDAGDGPDIKVNFGKKSNNGYDYSTSISDNLSGNSTTVTPNGSVKFNNEDWKYQIVDKDLVGEEVISTGVFNPITSSSSSSTITLVNNGVTIKFKYTIQ